MSSTKEPTLADRRAQVTRDAIIEAVQHLLMHEHPATISVPAVAKQAGVSVRTVYRYYPNKAALLDAVANHFPDRINGPDLPSGGREVFFDESEKALRALWSEFEKNLEEVRAEHQSPAGRELRARRLNETRTQMNKYLAARFPQSPDHRREVLADQMVAATSSSMFLELVDRLGYRAEQAADMAIDTVYALMADFERKTTPAAPPSDQLSDQSLASQPAPNQGANS